MFIPTPKTSTMTNGKMVSVPPISLDRPEPKKLTKTHYVTFKLRTNPTANDSPEYDFSMVYFRSGTPEELLVWIKNLRKVFTGMNITSGPGQYAMTRRVLQGDALSAFDRAAVAAGTETTEHLKVALDQLKKHMFPLNSYQRQRHYLNRMVRKPKDWSIREFVTRLSELNDYLGDFPSPSDKITVKKFDEHEIADIASNAIPNPWRKAMAMHNFDPLIHSMTEFTQFCERIQFAEGLSPHTEKISQNESMTNKSGGKARAAKTNNTKKRVANSSKWCELHQTDTHDTGECKVLLAQAKKMRSSWESGSVAKGNPAIKPTGTGNGHGNGKSVNWKSKPKDNYALELGNLIGKMIDSAATQNSSAGAKEQDDSMDVEPTNQNAASDSDDDVEVVEQYNVDVIEEFLNPTTDNDDDPKNTDASDKTSEETKKKSANGSD